MGLWENDLKRHLFAQVKFTVLVMYVSPMHVFPLAELSVELVAGPFWTQHIQLLILALVSSVTDGFGVWANAVSPTYLQGHRDLGHMSSFDVLTYTHHVSPFYTMSNSGLR